MGVLGLQQLRAEQRLEHSMAEVGRLRLLLHLLLLAAIMLLIILRIAITDFMG